MLLGALVILTSDDLDMYARGRPVEASKSLVEGEQQSSNNDLRDL